MPELKLDQEDGVEPPVVRTNTDFVKHVENTLGVLLDDSKPPWKARQIEAAKLKRKRQTKPSLYTIENLVLTVEFLRRRKYHVKSAVAVCWHVEEALRVAAEPEPVDPDEFEKQYAEAIRLETAGGDSDGWASRLTRARGNARSEVYAEWKAART